MNSKDAVQPPRSGRLINFRDFGGHQAAGRATVRQDRLYRCGHLAHLGDDEIERLVGLDFAVIADLRYPGERANEPSPWPSGYAGRILAHEGERATDAPHLTMLREGSLTCDAVEGFYRSFYRALPFDPLYRPLFAATIRRIADTGGRLLVHCAAGKDRTGVLCALILEALGVAREAIRADYLRSANASGLTEMKPAIIEHSLRTYGHRVSAAAVDALIGVKPDYLDIAFTAIEQEAGSTTAYLMASGIDGATLERLRASLLEP